MAKELINWKGRIPPGPDDGFWTVQLRNGDELMAHNDNKVHLSLELHPQKVGVFVDYEEALVSFYDLDSADLLYSFAGCCFTEKLLRFFSPCT